MEQKTLNQVTHLLKLKTFPHDINISNISVDSRSTTPGGLFFALKGQRVDGHHFLKEVSEKGAVGAVVNDDYNGPDYGLKLLFVTDTLKALQEFATRILEKRKVRVIAVTGSVGKTTTKEFIKTLLSVKYKVSASPGNSNSQIGIPLTIFNHTTGVEDILVLEMGMTHSGNIKDLLKISPPEVAVITTVALVHACNFESIHEIAKAKAEIFSNPSIRLGVLPKEVVDFEEIIKLIPNKAKSFSTKCSDADYFLSNGILHNDNQKIPLEKLNVPGQHNLHNLLAAIAVARYFNLSWEEINIGIKQVALLEKRLEFVEHKKILFLNDSYNANELSIKAALETLPEPKLGGKKVAVLGSMMELGKYSDESHARIGQHALNYVDTVCCLGNECQPIVEIFKNSGRPADLFFERALLVEHLKKILQPNDVVLLKGANSKQLWKVLEEL